MVASAKKYLPHSEHRILLSDLINDEVRRLDHTTRGADFSAQGQLTHDRFRRVVSSYEASSEALVRIFGVLGRWGSGLEFPEALEIILRLGSRGKGDGLVLMLALKTYPAVLLFYAYGIGLLKGRRYNDLFRLFSAELFIPLRSRSVKLTHALLLSSWKGYEEGCWKSLPGLEQRKTPLSDHLHECLGPWSTDWLFGQDEFTFLFEEFEFIAALAYITQEASSLDELKTRGQPDQWGRNFVWAPPGRISWDGTNQRTIISTYQLLEKKDAVTQAGFAHGSIEFLEEAIIHLERLFGRMSWM